MEVGNTITATIVQVTVDLELVSPKHCEGFTRFDVIGLGKRVLANNEGSIVGFVDRNNVCRHFFCDVWITKNHILVFFNERDPFSCRLFTREGINLVSLVDDEGNQFFEFEAVARHGDEYAELRKEPDGETFVYDISDWRVITD